MSHVVLLAAADRIAGLNGFVQTFQSLRPGGRGLVQKWGSGRDGGCRG